MKRSHIINVVNCATALLLLVSIGCGSNIKHNTDTNATQNSTTILLDSSTILLFLKLEKTIDSTCKQVAQFYHHRNYKYAWFTNNELTLGANQFYNQLQNYTLDFEDTSFTTQRLTALMLLAQTNLPKFKKQASQQVELELLLTTSFFNYAHKVYNGSAANTIHLEWYIPRKRKNYQQLLDSLVALRYNTPLQEPLNEYYLRLKPKLRAYRLLQKNGGLPIIIMDKNQLQLGDTNTCVPPLKQYLTLTEDLNFNDKSNVYTDSLKMAVEQFQQRMGLSITGKINSTTLQALNIPIAVRIQQILINMERLRWVPVRMDSNYLLINIPEYKLHVFENNKQLWATNVVVGKEVTPTSIFKGKLTQVVLNPYWTIPTSIVRKEILPKLKQNAAYLQENNIALFVNNEEVSAHNINWNDYATNAPFEFKQRPGSDNALGKVKFLFPNNFSIYLHDTPAKNLFGDTKRAFSHGCIRVNNAIALALYITRKDTAWDANKMNKVLATNEELKINIRPKLPVYIAYFTTWVNDTGQLNFRNDVYNLDAKLAQELFVTN